MLLVTSTETILGRRAKNTYQEVHCVVQQASQKQSHCELHASVMRGANRVSTQARTASRAAVSSGASSPSHARISCSRSCCCANLRQN